MIQFQIDVRMADTFEYIELIDLNKKRVHIIKCEEKDYFLDNNDDIFFRKKMININKLKEKREHFNLEIKIYTKTNNIVYQKKFMLSKQKLIKKQIIRFI